MSIFLPKKVVDVVLDSCFFSRPAGTIYPSVPKKFRQIDIHVGATISFRGHTIDPDFTTRSRDFAGKIRIMHNSSWGRPMDMHKLAMAQLIIEFPEQDGCCEVLSVYVDEKIIDQISKEA
jgi:hypothetical protein